MRIGIVLGWMIAAVLAFGGEEAASQVLAKSAINVDAGNTKAVGASFGYRLTYSCSSTSGPCLNAEVVDLLPAEVQYLSTVPASPTGDVAAINVTPNYMGTGRTRVQFVMITPLPAGNSGDLIVNVRFPNGSTPNGTVATNTADGINLGTPPGTFTTPPVNVTAVAALTATLQKTLQTAPANLDMPETYRLRISVPNDNGGLNLTAIGPVVDTLPPGTVFNGATPAADCQPGCVGTTPATLTWTAPCSVPLGPGNQCDITVNVTFPSATFPSGTSVTNSFVADITPLGAPPVQIGPGSATHPVTTFVPSPGMTLAKNMVGGTPNPPTLNQTFSYEIVPANNGNVPLDNLVVIDTLPVQMQVASVTTGAYNGLTDFAAGEGVRVSYEKNTAPGVFTLWGSSPNTTTSTTLTAPPPGLGAGEYLTRIRWQYGQAAVGMSASTTPRIAGQIVNPANNGSPVAFGDAIQNCVDSTAVYTAGPTNVTRNACRNFVLSGPFAQLNPAKENLSGGGPFNPGQTVSWRLRVRSAAQSSDPVGLEYIAVADLLPVDLQFAGWTFDDQGTGLPAPQQFQQIPNYAGSGRTLLRWRWNAGSGNLGVNQQVWINLSTTVRNGAPSGELSNTLHLGHDAPGLAQRCSGSSAADALDLDGDGNTIETLCTASGAITVAGIAQLVSSKQVEGVCAGGTLPGGSLDYTLQVRNVGTVPMQDFVLIDILPFVGDTGVLDTNPRNSDWTPLLAAPIVPPPGTTLYYSTSGNPCRGEVGGPVTGCDAPNWSTVPPTPITDARSFKIEFGSRVVQPFDTLSFSFPMTTPSNVALGQFAYNSFAYQAERSDGLGSLRAEPQKVGIQLGTCPDAASLGDYVWADANADGVQNDGPTGLNGIPVFLWQPGNDGVPGTDDDVLVSSTVTSPGPDSAPGWYNFPGLAPSSYFVCVALPPTFMFSPADAGGDDAADSDANPATGCAPVATLTAGQHNPTIDFGVVPTQLAALGNYVWFDRDSDGIQNESPYDGANGVTVRLWIDDGDNVPEPGTGDVLAATTVTADDIYGAPGYYLFDGLVPGVRYFVQFVRPAVATAFTSANAGSDDALDSDANVATGVAPMVVLAPNEYNPTIDAGLIVPSGTLALGDQVWFDTNTLNDGVFQPENGEAGVDGVRLDLYRDVNGDGLPTLDEFLATTATYTAGGFAGRYLFDDLAAGDYIVVVAPSNFVGGGALFGYTTATGNDPAPDPDDDVNGDDNGTHLGALIAARPVTLTANGEPTHEDGNANTNLTVDFGFIPRDPGNPTPLPEYDYGDAPDVGAGSSAGNYRTTALDDGAAHLLGVPGAPWLGACVDADSGFNQNIAADADDLAPSASTWGTCTSADDEDGVAFASPVVPGQPASFAVTAGGGSACVLNAWVDWNQNGVFGDAGEQIATNVNIPTGTTTTLTPGVPTNAAPGLTYARFRCASVGGLTSTGLAPDGEVEDYALSVLAYDYGDVPASYEAGNPARHDIDVLDAVYLGTCVDFETTNQPSANADGDDNGISSIGRVGLCQDDEDGVTLPPTFDACSTASIGIVASGAARLDGWIDWNRNGSFDAGEQIASNAPLVTGNNTLNVPVPCSAVRGDTYARFRISRTGGIGPTGPAADGEVEDYPATVAHYDWGDLPDTGAGTGAGNYRTLASDNGPTHRIVDGLYMGAGVDNEGDGQPAANADGDDLAGSPDDEDGVTIADLAFVGGTAAQVRMVATNTSGEAARVCGFIDWNGDGDFDDAGETAQQPVPNGSNGATFTLGFGTVPLNAAAASYARFRLGGTAGDCDANGAADRGEVEDYPIAVRFYDFGDLPDTYGTTLANNGPRHRIVSGLFLGATVDPEGDGQPDATATGDDTSAIDDEDGIVFSVVYDLGSPARVTAVATNQTGTAARVCGFIDWNDDGDFSDASETAQVPVPAGSNGGSFVLEFGDVPVDAVAAPYARFRLSTDAGCSPLGEAGDGEVEDYRMTTSGVGALSLGNQVFEDRNNNCTFDPGEPGIGGIAVRLYRDSDNDGIPDGPAIASTVTDGAGIYGFVDLLPDTYVVEIDRPATHLGSTGSGLPYAATGPCEPAVDPDGDVDNDDNGTDAGSITRSLPVTLVPETKPGPPDSDTNPTVDFGLLANFDLSLTKALAPGQASTVSNGSVVNYLITVTNEGTVPATQILVIDRLPSGTQLQHPDWTLSADGRSAQRTIPGPLLPGESEQLEISLLVTSAGGAVSNIAEIGGALDDDGNPGTDIDSAPDNESDGEDDQDSTMVYVPSALVPVNGAWALAGLLLMMLAVGTLRLHRRA